ncbi:MAG: DUF5924 family protein [Bacteroidales bacterium]
MNPLTAARARASRLVGFLRRNADIFWWLHSLWALVIGCGVMWLGSRHYGLLRVAIFQIAFIWVASLVVATLVEHPVGSSPWAGRVRLVVNYFSRNFYQQLLFFLLPIYWASSTFSWNLLFVGFVAVCALLSTLDVVYDRHLSVRRSVMAVFFAFNLFACINVMLPLLWSISNVVAIRLSAALALMAFVTILCGKRSVAWRRLVPVTFISAGVLFATVEFARPLIPPAPLRIVSATFGYDVDRPTMNISNPVVRVDPGFSGRLYALTAVYAPNGLKDRVGHRWYVNGELVWASPFHELVGGRAEGFRLWTGLSLKQVPEGRVRVDVETEGGQLIGRCQVAVAAGPPADAVKSAVPF